MSLGVREHNPNENIASKRHSRAETKDYKNRF